ncbi:MAG: hypothetical protein GWO20_00770 [Candidatus Korarchaeota archaeon]|nr:hypothetical protein [Candidatus Korarchaeota archaeon]NIU82114.1 hypothetical protein [Candidatus Thorarchaeota archaeon]NIW12525.1 hypothetical protein [Candidatus Thorarchaeota archaeon]NIW50744.1 hypothetical protein [Candidatus Korarchaeota archaeon]
MEKGKESKKSGLKLFTDRLDEPLEKASMPKFLGYLAVFGPGLIWAGVAQGSGELVWWPYMVMKYGLFFVGWLIIFAALQWWYNQEIGRYTVATGESIFEGWHRIHHLFGWLMLLMGVFFFIWSAGFLGGSASAVAAITNFPGGWSTQAQGQFWSVLILVILAIIVAIGPQAYRIVEIVESIAAIGAFFGMLITIIALPAARGITGEYFAALFQPKLGLPPTWDAADISIFVLLVVYTGNGGFFNMMYSYWLRDEGWGMAENIGRVTNPVTGEEEAIPRTGLGFEDTEENLEEYESWIRTLWVDNGFGVIFNLVTIMLTSILTYGVLRPQYLAGTASPPAGWELVVVQGEWLAAAWGEAGRILMLVIGFFFLFDVFLSVGDFSARVWSSNIDTNIKETISNSALTWIGIFAPLAIILSIVFYDASLIASQPLIGYGSLFAGIFYAFAVATIAVYSISKDFSYSKMYYIFLGLFYFMGVLTTFLSRPGPIIILTGITNMLTMVIACWALLYLNWFHLPEIHPAGEKIRPSWVTFAILVGISITFTAIWGWYLSLTL